MPKWKYMVYSTIRKHENSTFIMILANNHSLFFQKSQKKKYVYGCLLEPKVYFSGSELLYSILNWEKQVWI